jgi:hypothetical protein
VRLPPANRFTVLGLVVLALVALAAVAWLSKPVTVSAGQHQPVPRSVPVSTGARACPAPGAPSSHGAGLAVLAAAARPGPGRATVSRLSTAAAAGAAGAASAAGPLRTLAQPGTTSVSAVPTAAGGKAPAAGAKNAAVVQPGGVMIQAAGSMAQGLEVEQTSAGQVVTASCASPGTDFWFAVPGQQSAGTIELSLMNADGQAATVDVDIYTDAGPLQTGVDTGINVPAHGLVVQSLAGLVHGSRAVGLHVRTSIGRVVAALRETTRTGDAGQWLPPAQSPATHLVIPGMPASKGPRVLYLADGGSSDAQVNLAVVSPGGTYEPTGAGAIAIPAGSANRIELPSLSGVAGALVVTSTVPVAAAVSVPGGQPGAPGAMTAAAPAVFEQGVLAHVGQRPYATTLVLSATGPAARVRLRTGVTGLTSGGSSATQVVSIRARHSVTVGIAAVKGAHESAGFGLVLTPLPGSGPVYAGAVIAQQSGSVLGILPVTSALTSVPLPQVRGSLATTAP